MAIAVINGAKLQCTCGDAPSPLTVLQQTKSKISNQLAATIMDHKTGANIATFGSCKTLTAAAGGTPTPCAPITPAPWMPGSASLFLIEGSPALLNSDMLVCTVGGTISITDPGQQPTIDT